MQFNEIEAIHIMFDDYNWNNNQMEFLTIEE